MTKDIADVENRTDHKGKEYDSQNAMCFAWGINPDTYSQRRRRGWDKEKALTKKPRGGKITDPNGKEWTTAKEMCEHWNVPYTTYVQRVTNYGYSVAEALCTAVGDKKQRDVTEFSVPESERTDHEGTVFPSRRAMCMKWGISEGAYRYRKERLGFDTEKALTYQIKPKNEVNTKEDTVNISPVEVPEIVPPTVAFNTEKAVSTFSSDILYSTLTISNI